MLKTTIAFSSAKKVIIADRELETCQTRCFCMSCGCPLLVRYEGYNKAYFEHDQDAMTRKQLMQRAYYDGNDKHNKRQEQILSVLRTLKSITPITHWHCVLCSKDYQGDKTCPNWHSGVYSTENRDDSKTIIE
jgi:hypothetical protein